MTSVTLHLTDEQARKLQNLADQKRQNAAAVALEIVAQSLNATAPPKSPNDLPYDVWKREFDAWVKSHGQRA